MVTTVSITETSAAVSAKSFSSAPKWRTWGWAARGAWSEGLTSCCRLT